MFGTFTKEMRTRQQLGLREFCLEHGHDPSNWSKIEREVLQPPRDERTLRPRARQLGLKPSSDDWLKFFDYAARDRTAQIRPVSRVASAWASLREADIIPRSLPPGSASACICLSQKRRQRVFLSVENLRKPRCEPHFGA